MIEIKKEERQCSETKVGNEDKIWTVERLRGRLLAERQASRVAKEEAELLDKKLMELEIKLEEEAKLRIRAEKRLKKLMKILGSLKLSHNLEESDRSSSSAISCVSSAGTSASKEEEGQGPKSQITNQEILDRLGQAAVEKKSLRQNSGNHTIIEFSRTQGSTTLDSKVAASEKPDESTCCTNLKEPRRDRVAVLQQS